MNRVRDPNCKITMALLRQGKAIACAPVLQRNPGSQEPETPCRPVLVEPRIHLLAVVVERCRRGSARHRRRGRTLLPRRRRSLLPRRRVTLLPGRRPVGFTRPAIWPTETFVPPVLPSARTLVAILTLLGRSLRLVWLARDRPRRRWVGGGHAHAQPDGRQAQTADDGGSRDQLFHLHCVDPFLSCLD